jgi:predicted permease
MRLWDRPMRLLSRLRHRIRCLFHRRRLDRDLDDELQFHLDMLASQQKFGNKTRFKEIGREMFGFRSLEILIHDIRHAVRSLRNSPGFTAVALLSLALGIGANTAIFSVVNAVLLRPLAFRDPGQLVRVGWYYPKGVLLVLRERSRLLQGVTAYSIPSEYNMAASSEPERITGSNVSAEFFSVLGVNAARGRTFRSGEDLPGQDNIVILSDGLWRQRFASDPHIVGRRVLIDGNPREVVGVMPPAFSFPSQDVRLWLPLELDRRKTSEMWGPNGFLMVGRLGPRATLAQAESELKSITPAMRAAFPWPMPKQWGTTPQYQVLSLQDALTSDVRQRLIVVFIAVSLVLLVACANVANLLIARGIAQQKDLAIRTALGGGRLRLVRQLLTESVLLSLAGCAAGLLVAVGGLRLLNATLPADMPRLAEVAIDNTVLAFAIGLSILTGLAFGIIPAIRASRPDLEAVLKVNARTAHSGPGRQLLPSLLIVSEVALGVLLVTGAGLLTRSLWRMVQVEPGFRPEHVLTARVTPNESLCAQPARCVDFYNTVLDKIGAEPGVQAVAAASGVPLTMPPNGLALDIEQHPVAPGAFAYTAYQNVITPAYLSVMRIPLLHGRSFGRQDEDSRHLVVLISQQLARDFWPDGSAIGKHIKYVWQKTWREIVGVVGDVHYFGLTQNVGWQFYLPYGEATPANMNVMVRSSGDPVSLAGNLHGIVSGVNPAVPVSKIQTMSEAVSSSVTTPLSTMWLLTIFAALALALGAIGIYGVISYRFGRRTQEIGIRVAMGATPSNIRALVLREGLILAAIGVAVGFALSLAATRILRTLLFEVSPRDPLVFSLVPVVLVMVAMLACYLPARRATRVAPIEALRGE